HPSYSSIPVGSSLKLLDRPDRRPHGHQCHPCPEQTMTSRRTFIRASSLTLAAGATGVWGGDAHAAGLASQSLPSSVADLAPMRDAPGPITVAERKARIEKARGLMSENGMSAIVLAGGTSLDYFTGLRWGNSERLLALVLPVRGTPFVV